MASKADKGTRDAYRATLWLAAEYHFGALASAAREGRPALCPSRFADPSVRCPWSK
jgi:hypothetical protein